MKIMPNRREFINSITIVGTSPFFIKPSEFLDSNKGFMASLNPGAIGLRCSAHQLLDYAIEYKFSAISPLLGDLIKFKEDERKAYLSKMESNRIEFDSGGLPIEFRTSESKFQEGFQFLKKHIKTISSFKIPSFVTWIMPTHKSLTYNQNFEQHHKRLSKVANILEQAGLRLGLEYVGPKTLMVRDKYPFLHTIGGLRELVNTIGKKNVGYLLDSFHTYCAEDKRDDMKFLIADDIVSVQLNDAVVGRNPADQIDQERELPGDTGIIDLKYFLDFIHSKGYRGSVSVEPFNRSINLMETSAKLRRVRSSLLKNGI
jgi:sugar phosphate isomerase/epimerase